MNADRVYKGRSTIRIYNCDCMELADADKKWDLAIVDPPYGIDVTKNGNGSRSKKYDRSKSNSWDSKAPSKQYWDKLYKNTHNQIIFGMNYFSLPSCKGFVVWDKKQPPGVSFAQAELMWTSFKGTSKIVKESANGQQNRIHPTQKPVSLYRWLLQNYANEGETILDTHGGSMSLAIACWEEGFDLDICEIDKDYFNDAVKRFENHIAQTQLF